MEGANVAYEKLVCDVIARRQRLTECVCEAFIQISVLLQLVNKPAKSMPILCQNNLSLVNVNAGTPIHDFDERPDARLQCLR